jgi:predicted AlkP superfamily phosphohydrolase/phosphomutase
MRDGRLPNLSRIAEQGLYGPLQSAFPLLSPRVWNTVTTGKVPSKHGIEDWVRPTPRKTRLYYSYDRRCHALWNILSRAGYSVSVVNWLTTYPPEIIRGVMVSSHTYPDEVQGRITMGELHSKGRKLQKVKRGDERGSVVFPPEWTDRVLAARHEERQLTEFSDFFAGNEVLPQQDLLAHFSSYYRRDQQLVSVAMEIESEVRPDVQMILLQGIDRVSHWLWGGMEAAEAYTPDRRWSDAERAAARTTVERYYEYTDALIGRLLERSDADDLVIVASDHGFEPAFKPKITGGHDTAAAEYGVLFVRGRGIREGASTANVTIRDITPTILAWLGLPTARDMDGSPAAFLERELRLPIDTYDTTKIQRLVGAESGSDEAILDQLRALGYIE